MYNKYYFYCIVNYTLRRYLPPNLYYLGLLTIVTMSLINHSDNEPKWMFQFFAVVMIDLKLQLRSPFFKDLFEIWWNFLIRDEVY